MKNLPIWLLGMTLGLSGCFTVETAKLKSDGSEHVVMNDVGLGLLNGTGWGLSSPGAMK